MSSTGELLQKLQEGGGDEALRGLYALDGSDASLEKGRERAVRVVRAFEAEFGARPQAALFSGPGRTEIGGNHTDHQHGRVLCGSVDLDMLACAAPNGTDLVRIRSEGYPALEVDLRDLKVREEEKNSSPALVRGVAARLVELGCRPAGFDAYVTSTVLSGSGLSSSASVEVLTGFILRDMFGFDVTNQDLALIGQYSENNFNGVNCGIMDQFAIAMGKKDHAIFLDTADLSFEYAPIHLEGAKIVIACSNKKRGLGDSKYNERRSECETALAEIQEVVGINSLGDLTEEQFEQYKSAIKDDVRTKRAKHAVYENQRTIKAVAALKANDIAQFGQLMNASHVSLRDDYEVTGIELDTLVEEAWKVDGVIGSRMTGAGFGGCTVSIVKTEAIDGFIEKVGAEYLKKIGYAADFYVVEIGDGPSLI